MNCLCCTEERSTPPETVPVLMYILGDERVDPWPLVIGQKPVVVFPIPDTRGSQPSTSQIQKIPVDLTKNEVSLSLLVSCKNLTNNATFLV